MLQVTFPIHLKTHLHEQHFTASQHSKCSLSAWPVAGEVAIDLTAYLEGIGTQQ